MVSAADSNKPLIMVLQYEGNMIGRLRNIVGEDVAYMAMDTVEEVIKTASDYTERPSLVALLSNTLHMDDVFKINSYTRNENGLPIPIIAFSYEFDVENACVLLDNGVADYYGFDTINEPDKRRLRNYVKNYVFIKKKEASEEDTDDLTGVLNYNGLKRHFEILKAKMPNEVLVVVYADISNFKYFNYMFGYDEGNRLLRFWCDTITRHMSTKDLVCRMSADHFVIVMTTGQDDSTGGKDFKLILDEVRAHFARDFTDFTIDITSGVYVYNPNMGRGETLDEIIGYARHAQSVIKNHGGSGIKLFDDEVWSREKRYLELNGHLKNAIESGEIFLYLQPQYHTVTGELIGAECLCRWRHSTYGMLEPQEFIRALEKSGSVVLLDQFVWEEACKYIRKWLDIGRSITLSVNVSRKDVLSIDVPSTFIKLAEKYQIPPELLHIEITESAFMENVEGICTVVDKLHKAGFRVDMDDFGSGFSSLNFLHAVDVDLIKLDMGFLDKETKTARSSSILNAMIKMAHVLGIGVLAEGVEDAVQAEDLKNMGCLLAQGYYFAKPMPVKEFEELIKSDRVFMVKDKETHRQNVTINDLFDKTSSGYYLFNQVLGPSIIFSDDGETYRPVLVNDEFIKLLGGTRTREELERKRSNIFNDMSDYFKDSVIKMVKEAKKTGSGKSGTLTITNNKEIVLQVKLISSRSREDMYFCEAREIKERQFIK